MFPKLFALALVGGGFAFLITSIRVRVEAPEKSTPRKASVIYLRDDAQGRGLSLRAQEGGPFPSRFELSQWGGLEAMEDMALRAIRYQTPVYEPEMEDLPPAFETDPLKFASKGGSFFPLRPEVPGIAPDSTGFKLAPVLHLLSGEAITGEMPSWDAPLDAAMASTSWRFLLRLNPEGGVVECVSLEKGGEDGVIELEKWLQKVQFNPDRGRPFRWIAVGIGFTNQPINGTEAR